MASILIVDDDKRVMEYYETALKMHKFEVHRSFNGDDAMARIAAPQPFDVIILDIMMPPTGKYTQEKTQGGLFTGVLVYWDIRDNNKEVPIIILSNVSNDETYKKFPIKNDSHLTILRKNENPPSSVVELVFRLLSEKAKKATEVK